MVKVFPAQSVVLVMAAAPTALLGIARIFSMVLCAMVAAVVCNLERLLFVVATTITIMPPSSPTASTTMAIISSIKLKPRDLLAV